ncbi:hypothetical protein ACVWZA_001258 [Sphingomonas sp. UYAg733]
MKIPIFLSVTSVLLTSLLGCKPSNPTEKTLTIEQRLKVKGVWMVDIEASSFVSNLCKWSTPDPFYSDQAIWIEFDRRRFPELKDALGGGGAIYFQLEGRLRLLPGKGPFGAFGHYRRAARIEKINKVKRISVQKNSDFCTRL